MGAFGWLSGPDLQADGTANAALYDQRLALRWIHKNIHLFGGDRNRVTVFGESAGGASIMHQITAFGGLHGPAHFQQAILQSAAFLPTPSNFQQQEVLDGYLSLLKVKSVAEARSLPSSALIAANIKAVGGSRYGSNTFGPVVDGVISPSLPGKLLLQGSFDRSIKVMVGHNADEGLSFVDPAIKTDAVFREFIRESFPGISSKVLDLLDKVLYPAVFDGSLGYTDYFSRADLVTSELGFT